jgi:hypothetical protein
MRKTEQTHAQENHEPTASHGDIKEVWGHADTSLLVVRAQYLTRKSSSVNKWKRAQYQHLANFRRNQLCRLNDLFIHNRSIIHVNEQFKAIEYGFIIRFPTEQILECGAPGVEATFYHCDACIWQLAEKPFT